MKYYLYAIFFVILGIGFVFVAIDDSTPKSLNSLSHSSNVWPDKLEETLKGTKSERIKMTSIDNKHFVFEDWLPDYTLIVSYLKQGGQMDLWTRGQIVYQVATNDGPNISFAAALAAKKEQDRILSIFIGVVSILGFLWSIRQIKRQKDSG